MDNQTNFKVVVLTDLGATLVPRLAFIGAFSIGAAATYGVMKLTKKLKGKCLKRTIKEFKEFMERDKGEA